MQNLKQLRENKGITQIEISIMLGISYQSYRFYESGYRKTMSLQLEKKIGDILNCNYRYEPSDKLKNHMEYQRAYQKEYRKIKKEV